MMDNKGVTKIEAPLLDATTPTKGRPMPSATLLAPPPELLLGQQNLGKADTWLLGVTAAQLLTGHCKLFKNISTELVATQIKEFKGSSAMELLVPGGAAGKLDEDASDFIRQCLSL